MSLGKLTRRLGRLQASNRIKAHAQREAAEAISRHRDEWHREGARTARNAMAKLVLPADGLRPTLLNKQPEQPILRVPVFGRALRDNVASVAEFQYRPMEMRLSDQRIVWWDLVPMTPTRGREALADDVRAICDDLRHPLWAKHIGYHHERLGYIASKLESLVARMRLVVRETERAAQAEAANG